MERQARRGFSSYGCLTPAPLEASFPVGSGDARTLPSAPAGRGRPGLRGARGSRPATVRLRPRIPLRAVAALLWTLLVFAAVGCEDPFGPSFGPVPEEPVEAVVADFASSDLRDAAAFDFVNQRSVRTDVTAEWDVLYRVEPDGTPVLVPRGVIVGGGSEAGVQIVAETFSGLERAPPDGYTVDAPVPVAAGDVLALRSRQDPSLGLRCRRYVKLEIGEVDREAGVLRFRYLRNPNCEQRILIPGAEGDA